MRGRLIISCCLLAFALPEIGAQCQPMVTEKIISELDPVVAALRADLGENLYSCCLYGSAVRGNLVRGISDVNLWIVLNNSDGAAHDCVAAVLASYPRIDPFVLGREGFARSARAFAAKFASIKRNYRVVYGADPLAAVEIEASLERFLCEQAAPQLAPSRPA